MSHLTLDARAILHYLNELGYRNISAVQLKEFLKGMQPQSSINSTSKFDAKFNQQQQYIQEQLQQQLPTSSVTTNATAALSTPKRSPSVKVIKCKKPLCHFKFYLDICDHQLTKRIEEQIKLLGGSLEFFLTSNVTHFITDKPTVLPGGILQKVAQGNYNHSPGTPQTPATPLTPQTPYSLESQEVKSSNGFKTNSNNTNSVNAKKTLRQSRADVILSRARRQSVTSATNTPPFSALGNQLGTNSVQIAAATTPLKSQQALTASPAYILWQAEHALRFFKKVQHELKEYLGHIKRSSIKSGSVEPISLKGGFIKIETIRRNCRPYYQLFRKSNEWPKVEISREDGAFRLSPKREIPKGEENKKVAVLDANMTRKSRSRSSQHQSTVKILKKSTANSQRNAVACKQQQQQQQKESSDKQCGVCEICKIEYDTLTIHLKTKDHEYFAKNPQNFIALDTLIHTSADVNNFLEENRKLEIKSEPREMDVDDVEDDEEIGNNNEEEMIVPTVNINNSNKKNISEDSVTLVVPKSLSPTLREKSKRVTKGKHSSEKFQNLPSKSLKVPSPQKNVCIGRSFVNEIQSSVIASGLNKNCRKLSSSALSPPIRATLPPSSLYKVVETHTDLNCTPPKGRGGRDGAVAAASPSIIVKFKKVRATELQVLNGEAESFMFPKRRSDSSDLPTDIDRQTTSDRVGNTSSSTHSSFSEAEDTTDNLMRIDDVKSAWGKRAMATAKRKSLKDAIINSSKKINDIRKQSFLKAPIQPVQQLKQPTATRKKSTNNDVATAAAIVAATATITLPEATRKSSRTATAIVTAATTSSRLLQAAVEAAKSKNRHLSTEAATATYSKTKTPKKRIKVEAVIEDKDGKEAAVEKESPAQSASKLTLRQKRSRRKPIVKLEDGMGEKNRSKQMPIEDDDEDEIDYDDFDDATVDSDDIRDEDFVIEAERKAQARLKRLNSVKKMLSTNTREERATKRQNRLLNFMKQEPQECQTELDDSMQKPAKLKAKKPAKATKPSSKKSQRKSSANKKRSKKIERVFDFTKSERLKKLRYAFERLPTSDLWYRVYMRQDECQERYFEYYGTTSYRKLPYELGPIPFETTFLDGSSGAKICCNLCQSSQTDSEKDAFNGNTAKSELYNLEIKGEKYETKPPSTSDSGASSSNVVNDFANISGTTLGNYTTPQAYTHKHKKLHLLQRYRQEQEQQELLQRQKIEEKMKLGVDIKDDTSRIEGCMNVTPIESMREQRAGSTHSNASSCASSAATLNKAKKARQRHFNKASYLAHLELPPRKSPREHASTLALVSCIIKQRQDSLSKPNSETDEPPTTPLALTPIDIKPLLDIKSPLLPIETPAAAALPASLEVDAHSDSLRLQAPTPEEELRFATEISETVKRMRRGRNKYDYSPPFVARKVRRPRSNRGRGAANCVLTTTGSLWDKPLQVNSLIPQIPQTPCIKSQMIAPTVVKRRRGRQKACFVEVNSLMPSIRKTGSKKGVLEFEADATALKTLKSAPNDYVNPKLLEWQIDKYLSSVGRQYDEPEQNISLANRCDLRIPNQSTINQNTPPSTDHFSSDFDLCDLLNQGATRDSLGTEALGAEENRLVVDTKQKDLSFFNSIALHSYYRKRKTLKCNRTGWPKVSKKKSTCRQQKLRQRIYFMKASEPKIESNVDKLNKEGIKQEPMDVEDIDGGDNMEDNDDTTQERTRESAAITPPNSEVELNAFAVNANAVLSERRKQNEEQEDDETQMMLIEEQEDADTVLESVEEEEETNKMESDVDADIEEVDDDDDGEEEEEDVESRKPTKSLQFKRQTTAYAMGDESTEKPMPSLELLSPVEKFRNRLLNNSVNSVHSLAASSTPTIHLMRPLRRTPQLNGSLGSCISPSEKAGDNSDIFTVSSDGLETDLDLSNSHSQLKCINDDDSRHQNHHHYHESHLNNAVGNITPKRKFDISKYAPTNAATCAAEAATAAVKSLAISQFLKKEVRVTCRRLRAPFRRFRYRRDIRKSEKELEIVDLRKLIKYEEHMAINALQDDYFENLHRQTTASYRAKIQKEKSKQSVSSNGKRAGSHSGQYRRSSETTKRRRESADKENRLQQDLYQERPTTSKAADKANIHLAAKPSVPKDDYNESDLRALMLLKDYSSAWFNERILKNKNTQTSQERPHSKDQLKVGNGGRTNQLSPKRGSKLVTSHAGQEEDVSNQRQQALLAQANKINGSDQQRQEKRLSQQQILSNRGNGDVRASLEKRMTKDANELRTISKEGSKIVSSHLGLERDVINQRQPNLSVQGSKIDGRARKDQESHLSLQQLSLNLGSINIHGSLEKQLSQVASGLQTISIQDSKVGSTNSGFKDDIQNRRTQDLLTQNGKVDSNDQNVQERRSSQQQTFSKRGSIDVRGSLQKHGSKDGNGLQTISKQASKTATSNQSLKESILNEKRTSKMSGSAQNSQERRQSPQQLLSNRDDENIQTSWNKRLSKNADEQENGQKFSKQSSKIFDLNFSGSQEKRVSAQPPLSKQASKLADSIQRLQDNHSKALDKNSNTQKRRISPQPLPSRRVSINTGDNVETMTATQNARTRLSEQAFRAHSYSPSSGSSGTPTGIRRPARSAAQLTKWEPAVRKKGGQEQHQKQLHSRSPSCSSSGLSLRSRSRSRSVLGSRSSSTTRLRKLANADPVALYQYYKNEWNYFRQQIPGESKHEQLRWHIRQRLNPLDE